MLWPTALYFLQPILSTVGFHPQFEAFYDNTPSASIGAEFHHHPHSHPVGPRFGPRRPGSGGGGRGGSNRFGCGTIPESCRMSRYRTYDGTCNNLQNPVIGSTDTTYLRLLPPNYGDGISTPTLSITGEPLPLAREVSLKIYPDLLIEDPIYTINTMQYGQFVTHDMSMTAGAARGLNGQVRCCSNSGQLLEMSNDPAVCFPILIPDNDPIHAPQGVKCMNFVRTTTDRDRGCVGGSQPAEQLTSVNHYLDLSLVYGNTNEANRQLRLFERGFLRVEIRRGQQWPPRAMNTSGICDIQRVNDACYLTGDARANQNPQLTVLQITYVREHNRLAFILGQLNPHWNDEIIFQEARKINIAQHEYITYYEWLPTYLGEEILLESNILYRTDGYVNDYNGNINPSVSNAHANAAFRYFHTLIMGNLHLVTEPRGSKGSVRLSDCLNRPQILERNDDSFDDFARGLNTQPQHASDQFHDSEITHFLFRLQQQGIGSDLKALDIQRNRDHGLASYNDFRQYCGLPRATYFDDFVDVMSSDNIQRLASLYKSPEDVELTVGGSLEVHIPGTLAGPTFLCILKDQFYRTRVGDRFWFENDGPTGFSLEQLQQIRKASISRILCNNGRNIKLMQPKGFEKISPSNALVPCESLPDIDLTFWKETSSPLTNGQPNVFFKK